MMRLATNGTPRNKEYRGSQIEYTFGTHSVMFKLSRQSRRDREDSMITEHWTRQNELRERERMALRLLNHILSMTIPVEANDDWSCVKFNLKLEGGSITVMTGAQYHPSCNMYEVMEYEVQR